MFRDGRVLEFSCDLRKLCSIHLSSNKCRLLAMRQRQGVALLRLVVILISGDSIVFFRVFFVLFKDAIFKITPIFVATLACACVTYIPEEAKSAGLLVEPLALSMPVAGTSLSFRTGLGPLSSPMPVSTSELGPLSPYVSVLLGRSLAETIQLMSVIDSVFEATAKDQRHLREMRSQ
jgi:hypothetical protein